VLTSRQAAVMKTQMLIVIFFCMKQTVSFSDVFLNFYATTIEDAHFCYILSSYLRYLGDLPWEKNIFKAFVVAAKIY
jgi:hypothetical protein